MLFGPQKKGNVEDSKPKDLSYSVAEQPLFTQANTKGEKGQTQGETQIINHEQIDIEVGLNVATTPKPTSTGF